MTKKKKKQSSKTPQKPKLVSKIYIANWKSGDRYIYYNSETKERVTAKVSSFKSIREFREYVLQKGNLFGSKLFKDRTVAIKQGKRVNELTSMKVSGRQGRVMGSYFHRPHGITYYGTSKVYRDVKARLRDAKEDVLYNIVLQIIKPTLKMGAYESVEIEVEQAEVIERITPQVERNIKYKYIYSVYK